MQTAMILGFPVHTMSCNDSLDAAWRWLETDGPPRYMACANPYSLDLAIDDAAFASALREADLLVPDGVGMLIAGRILGKRFAERVVGMDFFTAVQAGLRCGR